MSTYHTLYLLTIVISLGTGTGCGTQRHIEPDPSPKTHLVSEIPKPWKTYVNSQYGFSFEYPASWTHPEKEEVIVNIKGVTIGVQMNFTDSSSGTSMITTYYLAPNGLDLYNYTSTNFDQAKSKRIVVGGAEAISTTEVFDRNGKGERIASPIQSTHVCFLNKSQDGEIELRFKVSISDKASETERFNHILASFQFSK